MLTDWMIRLRSLVKRRVVEQELDEELRFHFDRLVEAHLRDGLARDEAIRRARLQLGGLDPIKEEHRDARGIRLIDGLGRDVGYAARQIRRSPGFAVPAMLCLGLGIGVNIAIFSVVNSVLLRPMPVDDAERLITLSRGGTAGLTYPAYQDLRSRTRVLAGLAASLPAESDLDVDGESDFVGAEAVSGNYAEVVGIRPVLGRWFTDEREPVAVISYAVWEKRFGLSPQAIGRVVRSESQSYTIAGIAPRSFVGAFAPIRTDIWVPIMTRPRLAALEQPGSRLRLMQFGRLREGATPADAAAELNAIDAERPAEQGGAGEERLEPIVAEPVRGLPNTGTRRLGQRFMTLMTAVVGLVLLIACVNVANLLLVRGALRKREFALRRALGASRFRLLRQLLAESLLLALGGGLCGLVFALWTTRLLDRSFPALVGGFALRLDLSLDWRAVVFAGLISLAATILCGLAPAWRTSRASGLVAFKNEIGSGPPRRRPVGLVAQVVMSLVLLFVAGSFLQALERLQATDPGFDVAGRLYAYTWIPSPPFISETRREFYAQAMERLRALPGVRNVALAATLPLMPGGSDCASLASGSPVPISSSLIDTDYFDTMGIEVLAGSDFERGPSSMDAAVVSESLARRLWPDRSAVGERVMVGCKEQQSAIVIGVVRDSAIRAVGERPQPHLYRRFDSQYSGITAILLETSTDPAAMVNPVRRFLLELGQGLRVYSVQPLSVHVDQSFAKIRWLTGVLTAIGLLALVLAAVGLYGVIAYRVTLRTQEIGVRMALGASRADVFREVIKYGLLIVVIGVAIGEVLTAGLTGVVSAVQEGIRPSGVLTHVAIGLIWIAVALVACYLPAARAARVDPLTALRHE